MLFVKNFKPFERFLTTCIVFHSMGEIKNCNLTFGQSTEHAYLWNKKKNGKEGKAYDLFHAISFEVGFYAPERLECRVAGASNLCHS